MSGDPIKAPPLPSGSPPEFQYVEPILTADDVRDIADKLIDERLNALVKQWESVTPPYPETAEVRPGPHGYAIQRELLSTAELQYFNAIWDDLMASGHQGTIKGDKLIDRGIRDSRVRFLDVYEGGQAPLSHWLFLQSIYLRLVGLAHVCQQTTLAGTPRLSAMPREQMQMTEYRAGQFYNHHQDADGSGPDRVLSVTLLVGRADIGGEFMFRDRGLRDDHAGYVNKPGTAIVFPSTAYHGVRSVVEGVRRSIVLWCSGEPATKEE